MLLWTLLNCIIIFYMIVNRDIVLLNRRGLEGGFRVFVAWMKGDLGFFTT